MPVSSLAFLRCFSPLQVHMCHSSVSLLCCLSSRSYVPLPPYLLSISFPVFLYNPPPVSLYISRLLIFSQPSYLFSTTRRYPSSSLLRVPVVTLSHRTRLPLERWSVQPSSFSHGPAALLKNDDNIYAVQTTPFHRSSAERHGSSRSILQRWCRRRPGTSSRHRLSRNGEWRWVYRVAVCARCGDSVCACVTES